MARGGVNKAVVQTARMALLARGENPSIDAVRIEMGNTGSKTTIHRYLKELDEQESKSSAPAPQVSDELTELVSRLAQRLKEQAQERIHLAQAVFDDQMQTLSEELARTQLHVSTQEQQLNTLTAELNAKSLALDSTRGALQAEQTSNARLIQSQLDQDIRLQDKDGQIRSLEEKHLHARDALEHYRNSVKEQREQEQRRHEGQLQQVQMEIRQAQQAAMVRQEEITQLNRDNERLLSETRSTLRELSAQQEQLKKATHETSRLGEQYQLTHTQCALLQERLSAALDESSALKQTVNEHAQANQTLHLELIKSQLALESAALLATQKEPELTTPL
ncbi:DNA-binding protein [Pseudomonas sp. MH10]|uniref:DNA-binding protein n=1 Tax=Pseudomonas sp. MH10 TaxID=3048627 RepID=UPI002AC9A003|nr:DNA-binding protein [Pseudomonas sp. MH10]MEB0040661.1 DNA-binding protein [Pseudomonas sp. MH10]WPX64828.1 DNA-binding protein [Pseudomonas sp. MH10]